VENEQKRCARCGQVKPVEEFPFGSWRTRANGIRKRYRDSYCADCRKEYSRTSPSIRASKAAYQRKYRLRDPEAFKVKKRISRQNHPTTHNARSKRWVEANPEKRRLTTRICEQKRRAMAWSKKQPDVRAAIEQALELARFGDKYLDAYSGDLIDDPTIDHIVPLSQGGSNDADNLCVTSLSNNSSKFNDTLLVWLVKRANRFASIRRVRGIKSRT
jgi:5-methylcytosine-specific restriction endonuclease McrA